MPLTPFFAPRSVSGPRKCNFALTVAILSLFGVQKHRLGVHFERFMDLGTPFSGLGHHCEGLCCLLEIVWGARPGNFRLAPNHKHPEKHGGGHCAAAQLDPRGALGAREARVSPAYRALT